MFLALFIVLFGGLAFGLSRIPRCGRVDSPATHCGIICLIVHFVRGRSAAWRHNCGVTGPWQSTKPCVIAEARSTAESARCECAQRQSDACYRTVEI